MTTIYDQHIRQQALIPTESFIVQAPAGSGKTELLTQRYLVLLTHAQKAPEEIVAITFTRKAAAEMRARILSALAFAQTPTPDQSDYRFKTWELANKVNIKDEKLNWQLVKNPNRLRILTIDALAAFVCRQTPLLTHFGTQPQISEQATPLYQQAIKNFILDISKDSQRQADLTQLLLHLDNQTNKLEALLLNLLENRDQWLPSIMEAYLHPDKESLRCALERSLERIALEKMALAQEAIPTELKQTLILLIQHAGRFFETKDTNNPLAACSTWNPNHTPQLEDLPTWTALARLLLTKTGEWKKTVTIRMGFDSKDPQKPEMLALISALQNCDTFKDTLNDLLICPPIAYTDMQWSTLTTLTHLLPLLVAQLMLVFQEKGEIDFIALNLAALKALGTEEMPTDMALYLDHQIQHLLIDEFQDTSVTHMEMIEKITRGWEPDDGRTLFLVGDPMQSIYRFRNAEVGLFLRTQEQGIGHINLTPLTLTMNFRSQKGMVDWFNIAFEKIFPKTPDIATGRVPYTPAIAALPLENDQCVQTHLFTEQAPATEEAQKVVEIIQAYQKADASKTIAILSRSRSQLSNILHALHQHHIAFQAIDIEPLTHRPEIQDLLALTRALHHRADRIAWLSILRAPFCGLTLSDLHAIATHDEQHTIWEAILAAESISELSTDGLNRITRLRNCFTAAFSNQNHLSLSQYLEGIWIQLGGPATLNSIHEINQVQCFFNLINKVQANSALLEIDRLSDALNQLFAKPNTAEAANIHIMTIHKSKGLEFDHVIIPGLQRQTPPDKEKLFRWLERPSALGTNDLILAPIKPITDDSDAIYHYLKQVEREKLDHEMTRLFYVAATRAKRTLHLMMRIQQNDKKPLEARTPNKSSFLGKLWPLVKEQADALCAKQQITQTSETNTKQEPAIFHRLSTQWHNPLLSKQTDATTQPPKLVSIPLDLTSQAAQLTGTLIHHILQNIANTQNYHFDNQSVKQWRAELLTQGLLPSDLDHSISIIKTAMKNIAEDQRAQWILSNTHKNTKSEWALSTKQNAEIKHYIIDRTFIDAADQTRWIIDYKTSQPKEGESLVDFLNNQKTIYQQQLDNYAKIVAEMEECSIKLGLYFPLCKGWIDWLH